jgi:hypothetical protein
MDFFLIKNIAIMLVTEMVSIFLIDMHPLINMTRKSAFGVVIPYIKAKRFGELILTLAL